MEDEKFYKLEERDVLLAYATARYEYQAQKTNGKISYEEILKELNSIDLDSYSGPYKNEIAIFKDSFNKERLNHYKVIDDQIAQGKKEEQKKLDDSEMNKIDSAIKSSNFKDVVELTIFKKDYEEKMAALYYFAQAQISKQSDDKEMMIFYLSQIPINYNGPYSELILNDKLSYKTREEWASIYKEQQQIAQEENDRLNDYAPGIGMTSEEVKNSTWGAPKEINKTTTRNTESEQWVYDNYKYIYLENGIVQAIQE